jgi:hypothetical protein
MQKKPKLDGLMANFSHELLKLWYIDTFIINFVNFIVKLIYFIQIIFLYFNILLS